MALGKGFVGLVTGLYFRGLSPYRGGTGFVSCSQVARDILNLFKSSRVNRLIGLLWAQTKRAPFRELLFVLVPRRGLEPPRLSALPPQGSVYTNFTTWA